LRRSSFISSLITSNFQDSSFDILIKKISPITPHQIQNADIKQIENTFTDSVFDISLAMEIPTTEIDNDEDNVIFYIDKQPMGILYPRKELKRAYVERSSFYIACNRISYSAIPISIVKPDNIYFRINLTTTIFIHIEEMIQLLSSEHKEWLVQSTDKNESNTANVLYVYDQQRGYMNILDEPIDIVSGDHCQDGTTQYISSLTPIKFPSSPNYPTRNSSSIIPSPLKSKQKRCPKGTLKNKRTGNCEKKRSPVGVRAEIVRNNTPDVVAVIKPKTKRCPNGTRKNRVTDNCVPK
jgi:hypothetical protein